MSTTKHDTQKIADIEKQIRTLTTQRDELVRQSILKSGFVKEGTFALVTFKVIDKDQEANTTPVVVFNAPGTGMVVMNAYIDVEYSACGLDQIKEAFNRQVAQDNVQVKSVKNVDKMEALKYL